MTTHELINMLSVDVDRVDRRLLNCTLGLAVITGAAGSLVLILLVLGVRTDLADFDAVTFLLLKLAFTLSVVMTGYRFMTKLVRPGSKCAARSDLVVVPFAVIIVLAAAGLALAPRTYWETMIIGEPWLQCLMSILIVALLPFAVITWGVRQTAAPTDLVRSGAIVGLIAGGVSAVGYALHCTEDSLAFVPSGTGAQ